MNRGYWFTPCTATGVEMAILKRCHPIKGFIYEKSWFGVGQSIAVRLRPRHGAMAICLGCGLRGKTYDTARNPRSFIFIPFWVRLSTILGLLGEATLVD